MRIMTLARFKAAILLAAVLALVPQFAFAQLPVETQQLKLQGSTSGALILKTAGATTDYTLTYPEVQGTVGAFLFLGSTDGTLKWSNAAGGDNYVPIWDADANGAGNGGIVWVDPAGESNPNWTRTGNAITVGSTGKLGTTSASGINIVTNDNMRINIASDGVIGVNATATGGATTTIGRTGHTTNVDGDFDADGAVRLNADEASTTDINTGTSTGKVTIGSTANTVETNAATWDVNAGTATIDASGTLTVTGTTAINNSGTATTDIGTGASAGTTTIGRSGGTTTVIGTTSINNNVNNNTSINTGTSTGTLAIGNSGSTTNILGATTINSSGSAATTIGNTGGGTDFTGPIKMAGDNGASGEVLVSKGVNATPEWQNLTESIGIRKVGVVDVTNLTATAAITVAGLAASDAIIVTLQTATGSTVVGTVTNRTNSNPPTTPNGGFIVTFSGRFEGSVNYMVIKALN